MTNKKAKEAETPNAEKAQDAPVPDETAGTESGTPSVASSEKSDDPDPETIVLDVETADTVIGGISSSVRAEAQRLLRANNIKKIWRCPKKGYWFTREDYANGHAKKTDVIMQTFLRED